MLPAEKRLREEPSARMKWRLTGGSLLGNADQGRGTPEKARREEGVKMGGAQEGRQFRKKDKEGALSDIAESAPKSI